MYLNFEVEAFFFDIHKKKKMYLKSCFVSSLRLSHSPVIMYIYPCNVYFTHKIPWRNKNYYGQRSAMTIHPLGLPVPSPTISKTARV